MKIYGNILLKDRFFNGTIEIKDGMIESIWTEKRDYDFKGTVIPTFVNMHTHIGDYYFSDEITKPLKEVVGPNGLKFKILENSEAVREGMRRAIDVMEQCGISHFVDFREGGEHGVSLLHELLEGRKIKGVILGRDNLWKNAQGISVSSISDVPYKEVMRLANIAHSSNAIFALHASEEQREDIDKILALNPHFIVHFLKATKEDLLKVSSSRVPVVLTPRANVFWGSAPDIARLVEEGITVALGTDNGMIAEPCMFREMEFAYRISRLNKHVSAEEILKMATLNGRKILGVHDNEPEKKARLIIFRRIMSPYEIVARASRADIYQIIL